MIIKGITKAKNQIVLELTDDELTRLRNDLNEIMQTVRGATIPMLCKLRAELREWDQH